MESVGVGRRKLAFVKQLDMHPKALEEVHERSTLGAIITLLTALLIFILMVSELKSFVRPQRRDIVFVDTVRNETLNIDLDVVFLRLPCSRVRFDVVDDSGELRRDFVLKQDIRLEPIKWGDSDASQFAYYKHGRPGCPSCYVPSTRHCCHTCADVLSAFRTFGRNMSEALASEQCRQERKGGGEACRVRANIVTLKGKGNMHVAAGTSVAASHGDHRHHQHLLSPAEIRDGFDTSHAVLELSFGQPFPGQSAPLRGLEQAVQPIPNDAESEGFVQVVYLLQIVPSVYVYASGREVKSFQYSMGEFRKKATLTGPHGYLPGVFWKWDVSALRVHSEEIRMPFLQLLTRLCALVGSVWVVAGIVYRAISSFLGLLPGLRSRKPSAATLPHY
jgi:hypothetical protein